MNVYDAPMIHRLFTSRIYFTLALLAALGALGSALVAQFGFDLKPCILCLWQRLPYALILLVSIAALVKKEPALPFLGILVFLFLSSFGIAFFHVGVEQHWWTLDGGCPVTEDTGGKSAEEVLAQILSTPTVPCDKVLWRLFGLSITVWNAVLSTAMAAYGLIVIGIKK